MSSRTQSAGGFDIAENFTICIFKVLISADRRRQFNRLTREDVAKRSILQINNIDNLFSFQFSPFARNDTRTSRA